MGRIFRTGSKFQDSTSKKRTIVGNENRQVVVIFASRSSRITDGHDYVMV